MSEQAGWLAGGGRAEGGCKPGMSESKQSKAEAVRCEMCVAFARARLESVLGEEGGGGDLSYFPFGVGFGRCRECDIGSGVSPGCALGVRSYKGE